LQFAWRLRKDKEPDVGVHASLEVLSVTPAVLPSDLHIFLRLYSGAAPLSSDLLLLSVHNAGFVQAGPGAPTPVAAA